MAEARRRELKWLVGSLFIMGFEGTTVSPQIEALIREYHIGAILLTAKNVYSAAQATQLTQALQEIAHRNGYEEPLLIAIDQENGGVNSVFDSTYIQQFPSAMGIAASNSPELARAVGVATAKELSCIGVNWLIGPVLDVLSNMGKQPIGVRALGVDPNVVSKFGLEFIDGYQSGGVATTGKHFPSYGNLEFLGSPSDIPIISETIDQLRLSGLVPFQAAIKHGVDAMQVGACAMSNVEGVDVPHACLSDAIVNGLLRRDMGFNGVVLSECLEVESMYDSFGVGQATIMGLHAGCDVFMVCHSFQNQLEAMSHLQSAVENGIVSVERLQLSASRISRMKQRYTSWQKALNPLGITGLESMRADHDELSENAYVSSMSLVRDNDGFIPLTGDSSSEQELLLLTPLVEAFPGARPSTSENVLQPFKSSSKQFSNAPERNVKGYLEGEMTFRQLGLSLAQKWPGKVLHCSYTASGIRPQHEDLVTNATTVIVLTADGGRNLYQYGFTKYVSTLCKSQSSSRFPKGKPCIVVAVSSPYDFMKDTQVGTYICTYDFTDRAMDCLVRVLTGDLAPTGFVPGMRPKAADRSSQKKVQRRPWLVKDFKRERDLKGLQTLLDKVRNNGSSTTEFISGLSTEWFLPESMPFVESHHFIVHNSSTKVLYGFCATYVIRNINRGSIAYVLVDPDRRKSGIGHSLHQHAVSYLVKDSGVQDIQFGTDFPALIPGISCLSDKSEVLLKAWAEECGWMCNIRSRTSIYRLQSLDTWAPPPDLQSIMPLSLRFEIARDSDSEEILQHISSALAGNSTRGNSLRRTQIVWELYTAALKDPQGSSVIVTRDSFTTQITGTSILYSSRSTLAQYLPIKQEHLGYISGIVIASTEDWDVLTQGHLAMGVSQFKARGFGGVEIRQVDGCPSAKLLEKLGFELVHDFYSLISSAEQFA